MMKIYMARLASHPTWDPVATGEEGAEGLEVSNLYIIVYDISENVYF